MKIHWSHYSIISQLTYDDGNFAWHMAVACAAAVIAGAARRAQYARVIISADCTYINIRGEDRSEVKPAARVAPLPHDDRN